MAKDARKRSSNRAISERTVYEPRVALRRVQGAILALVIIATVGVLGYMVLEGWSFTDALYMTVITLTTVGYREVRTLDNTGQLWTMLLLVTGVGTLFYAAVSSVELVVEGTIRGYFGRRRMEAAIGKLSGHQILCGYGRVGRQVAAEFARDGVPYVVVDQDPEIVEECVAEGYLVLLGEASDDDVLEEAGVRRAEGLVAAVDSDADNVFVVLSARKLNPRLNIVARGRLASLVTLPLIVDFLEIVTRGEKVIEFILEEFGVPEDYFIAGHTIGELRIGEKTGAMILATRNKEGTFDTTPSASDRLRAGDTLIVLGTREQISRLEQLMGGKELR